MSEGRGGSAGEEVREESRKDPTPSTPGPRCDLCGAPMRESHCKLICDRCGYTRDCSDP